MMRKARRAATAIALLSSAILGVLPPAVGHAGEPPAVAASVGCGTKRIGEITVAALNSVPIVTLLADGVPVVLLLDTGAARTILTPPAAQRIGAQPPRVEFNRRMSGIAGALPIREVELRSFTIGGVAIPWHRIAVAPTTLPSVFFGPLDGLLGADVLSSFDIDIDLSHHRMILHEKQSCPDAAPDWAEPYVGINTGRSRSEHLFFPVQLDGHSIVAIVDTGAQMTALSSKTALALGVSEAALAHDPSKMMHGATGEQVSGHIHRFSQLKVGEDSVRDPEITVADLNLPDADLVLGFDFVRSRRMWFSYGSRRIFLSRARR
jgi:predicted aspartyl protease